MAGPRALGLSALLGLLICSPHAAIAAPSNPGSPSSAPAAFGIVAVDSIRQEWGVATVSRWIAVGARSIEARAGAGAWLALELPDPHAAETALARSAEGRPARMVLDTLLAQDARRAERQIAMVDRGGSVAASTGDRCPAWSGERFGKGYVCQGVALRGSEPLNAMARAFELTTGTLAERLIAAVEAAEAVAPLRDEVESSALLVVREGGGPSGWSDRLIDLRVDAAPDAVQGLKNLYAVHAATFLPAAYARFGDDAKRRGDPISAEREYQSAEAGFRAAVARKPSDADAVNELAWFLATHDRALEEAVRLAKTAASLRPRDPILFDTLAEAEYRSGSLTRAILAMERAVKYSGGAARYTERLARWNRERAALEGKSGTPASP
ncbi:MAG TPA: DUF1028 domain-containing protein [Candidatus Dormibacteraeota bacterium]|nr:DUF1028 domain-containing protein [Candidatus Dormibacteraeota bacterium]